MRFVEYYSLEFVGEEGGSGFEGLLFGVVGGEVFLLEHSVFLGGRVGQDGSGVRTCCKRTLPNHIASIQTK